MKPRIAPAAALLILLTACAPAGTSEGSPGGSLPATAAESVRPTEQLPFDAAVYVGEALDHIEELALFVPDLDWSGVRAETLDRTSGATTPEETHDALAEALERAGGRHSTLRGPVSAAGFSYIAAPEAGIAAPGIAVVDVPGFRSPRPEHVEEYARRGNEQILAAAPDASCGWIVDLRKNYGGNMWPMLGALSPLLPDGEIMQFIDRDGRTEWAVLHPDGVYLDGEFRAPAAAAKKTGKPVALLQSEVTSSSVEAVLLSFADKPGVRSFGAPTAGLATGNVVRTLTDGTGLRITSSYMATALGQSAGGGPLQPDVRTEDPLAEATEWLRSQCRTPR
ncbi:MAG: S41 family peptidase [Arthrobacter sp.]